METTKQLIQTSITAVIKGHGKCKRASTSSKRLWWGVQPHSCTPPMCYKSSSHQTSFLHMLKPNTSIFFPSTCYHKETFHFQTFCLFGFLSFGSTAQAPGNHSGHAKATRVQFQGSLRTAQGTDHQLQAPPGHYSLTL